MGLAVVGAQGRCASPHKSTRLSRDAAARITSAAQTPVGQEDGGMGALLPWQPAADGRRCPGQAPICCRFALVDFGKAVPKTQRADLNNPLLGTGAKARSHTGRPSSSKIRGSHAATVTSAIFFIRIFRTPHERRRTLLRNRHLHPQRRRAVLVRPTVERHHHVPTRCSGGFSACTAGT
jgi:hypothetical protein